MEGSYYGTQQEIVGVFQVANFYTKYLIFFGISLQSVFTLRRMQKETSKLTYYEL